MRILFLSGWFPYPPDNGSKIRILNCLQALAQRHEVTLVTFTDTELSDVKSLAPYCHVAGIVPLPPFRPTALRAVLGYLSPTPRSVVATHSPAMAQQVRHALCRQRYDIMIASQLRTAPYVPAQVSSPTLFDEVETGAFRVRSGRAMPGLMRARQKLMWLKLCRYLRATMKRFDACTVVSKEEQKALREIVPNFKQIEVIANGVDVSVLSVVDVTPQPDTLIFNGALTYSANYDAMHFFLSTIWPRVKAERPGARLLITGRADGVKLNELPMSNDVALTGHLPTIGPTLASAWLSLAPLRIGGGTRLKILEAMALGTPVVATTKGAEGLDVTPEEDILIADEPSHFAAQTVRLLQDVVLRQRLADGGRKLVAAKYDRRMIGTQFNRLVENIVLKRRDDNRRT